MVTVFLETVSSTTTNTTSKLPSHLHPSNRPGRQRLPNNPLSCFFFFFAQARHNFCPEGGFRKLACFLVFGPPVNSNFSFRYPRSPVTVTVTGTGFFFFF